MEFEGTLEHARGGGCVVRLPDEITAAFGTRRMVPVRGLVGGVDYRSVLFPGGDGSYWLGVYKATREAAGLTFGDAAHITVEPDDEPREVVVPDDLRAALDAEPELAAAFDRLPPSHRREHAEAVAEAKRPETRERRIAKALDMLRAKL